MALRPVHFNARVLTVFLVVALPVLTVGGIAVLGLAQSELRESFGAHVSPLAERTAAAVDASRSCSRSDSRRRRSTLTRTCTWWSIRRLRGSTT
jgi:hypothetical protein